MNTLNKYEIDEILESSEEEQTGWSVNSLESVNWALRKISALNKQVTENEKLAKQEVERIKKWEQKENESHKNSIIFFEQKISEYHQRLVLDDPKAVIKTPYGKVSLRKVATKLEYGDALVGQLKDAGLNEFIRIKEEVDKAGLKKSVTVTDDLRVVTADGEVLSSITVIPESQETVIKVED